MKISKKNTITAIDIGSYKISGAVFHMDFDAFKYQQSQKALHCLSAQIQKTRGFSNGSITHFDEFEESILATLNLLEKESKQSIDELYVVLPGHIFQSHFITKTIDLNGTSVSQTTIQNLIHDTCQNNKNGEIIHIAPIRFDIDDASNIEEPHKMVGNSLTTYMHAMSTSKTLVQNLKNMFSRYDLKVINILASPVVQSLNFDPTEQGVILDFGHDATNITIYKNGKIVFHEAIPMGGRILSKSIALALNTSFEQAERVKNYNGYISSTAMDLVVNGETFQNNDPNSIIQFHMQELMHYIKNRLGEFDSEFMKNISITGGSAELKGLTNYVEGTLRNKVSLLSAQDGIKSPSFSTCFGAVQYGYFQHCNQTKMETFSKTNSIWNKIRGWFNEDL